MCTGTLQCGRDECEMCQGEGGLDDATGAGGRGGASYSQTSDVVDLKDVKRGEEGDSFGMEKKSKPMFSFPKFKLPWES